LNQIRGSSGIPKPDSAKPDHALATKIWLGQKQDDERQYLRRAG
jgi:hypothetical protein